MMAMKLGLSFLNKMRKTPTRVVVAGGMIIVMIGVLLVAPHVFDVAGMANAQALSADRVFPKMPQIPVPSAKSVSICPKADTGSDVSVVLKTDLTQSVPSSVVGVYATLSNYNSYAAEDGVLVAHITKKGKNGQPDRVIDSFIAAQNIDVPASKSAQTTFTWNVPTMADSADYFIDAEYIFSRRPYLDPMMPHTQEGSNVVKIPIRSPLIGSIYLDPATVQVNGHGAIADQYVFARASSTPVHVMLMNDSDIPYHGVITWTLYDKAESPISIPPFKVDQPVIAHPHTRVDESFILPILKNDVYYLQGHLTDTDGSRSVIGMPLVREGSCESSLFGGSGEVVMLEVLVLLLLILAGVGYFTRRKWLPLVFKRK